jgi:hypothetical protein
MIIYPVSACVRGPSESMGCGDHASICHNYSKADPPSWRRQI